MDGTLSSQTKGTHKQRDCRQEKKNHDQAVQVGDGQWSRREKGGVKNRAANDLKIHSRKSGCGSGGSSTSNSTSSSNG